MEGEKGSGFQEGGAEKKIGRRGRWQMQQARGKVWAWAGMGRVGNRGAEVRTERGAGRDWLCDSGRVMGQVRWRERERGREKMLECEELRVEGITPDP